MKVTVEDIEFKIVFIKEKDIHRDGTRKINSICRILHTGDYHYSEEQLCGEGRANLNYRDSYNKVIGKKIALKRAMESPDGIFWHVGPSQQCKKRRAKVWEAFRNHFPVRTSAQDKLVKELQEKNKQLHEELEGIQTSD